MFKHSMVITSIKAAFKAVAQLPLTTALRILADLGYDGLELSVLDPQDIDVAELRKQLRSYAMELPAISTGLNYLHYGLSLTAGEEERRRLAIARLKEIVDLAEKFDSAVIIGLIRGKIERGQDPQNTFKMMTKGIKEVCEYADKRGTSILFEPLNRYETNLVNTVDEAMEVLEFVGMDNLYLLLDTFHMNIEEPSIEGSILKAGEKVGHVHIADSNRLAPGMGHIDFAGVIEALKTIGYSRFLSAEIITQPSFEEAARLTIKTLRSVEEEL